MKRIDDAMKWMFGIKLFMLELKEWAASPFRIRGL